MQVGDRRRAARGADLVEHAGVADVVNVMPGAQRIRSGLAVTGNAAEHQSRIDARQRLVAEAQLVHHAGAEALDQDVGGLHQFLERSLAVRVLEIEAQATLVAVHHLVQVAGVAPHRTERAGVVARAGVLDLDDIGTIVGEMLGGERAGQQASQIKHADTRQRQACGGIRVIGHERESGARRRRAE